MLAFLQQLCAVNTFVNKPCTIVISPLYNRPRFVLCATGKPGAARLAGADWGREFGGADQQRTRICAAAGF
jgi:hypothetical protein